eukprot:11223801-Lingulodinium_polyedra.AAC.1
MSTARFVWSLLFIADGLRVGHAYQHLGNPCAVFARMGLDIAARRRAISAALGQAAGHRGSGKI